MANGANPWLGAALAFQGGLGGQGPAQGLAAYNQIAQQRAGEQDRFRQLQTMMELAEADREARQRERSAQALQKYAEGVKDPQKRVLLELAPDVAAEQVIKTQFAQPEPPQSRTRVQGGREIFEEYDPQARTWQEVSAGPRWKPEPEPGMAEVTTAIKTREHKIDEYMRLFDLPRDEATLRVDRGYDLHTTSDGRLVERNPITLETKDVTPPHPQFTLPGQEQQGEQDVQPAPQTGEPEQERAAGQRQVPQERTLWSLAEDSPGVMRSLEEVGSAVSGQFGGPIAEETIDARQAFRTALGELRRSMAVNSKYPVKEMEWIANEMKIEPSAWDNPASLRARLRSIDDSLRLRIDNELAAANNPMLPSDQRGAAMQRSTNLHNFRQLMGVPQEGARETPQQGEAQAQPGMPEVGTVEEGYRFKGGDPADPDSWEPVR